MIILTETTDNLQAVLAGAVTTNQLQCMSCWRDITTTAFTPGRTLITTNSANDVNIVGAPGGSTQRVVDYVSIYNSDTATATVTVKLDANGTEYILAKVILAVGEKLEYGNDLGWRVLSSDGAIKESVNQGAAPITTSRSMTVLSGDVVNNNAVANSIADVTGLSFAVTSGNKYWFKFVITYTSAATTTGSRWAISGPATAYLAYVSNYSLTATSWTFNSVVAYDTPAACNATSAATTGNTAVIEGIIVPSANGTVIARFASEVSNSAITAKAGSFVEYLQVA